MNRRHVIKMLTLALGGSLALPALRAMAEHAHKHHSQGKSPETAYQYRMFDKQTVALLEAFTDVIIPRTDTPGARDAAVPAFIDLMLAEWYDEKDTARFMAGLSAFTAAIQNKYNCDFISLSPEKRYAEVEALDRRLLSRSDGDNHFYPMAKELTLIGYYTSKEGMETELHYQGLIGEFDFEPSGPPGSVTLY